MSDFKKGDVVKLKSGGPVMTVQEIDDGPVNCTWFDKSQVRQSDAFDPELLKRYDSGFSGVTLTRG